MTLREAVVWGEEQLKNAPREAHARRDAECLLLVVVGKDKAWLMAHGDDALQATDFEKFCGLIERRATGEPMQYIVGECEFFGMPFKVSPAVLIPRPETEHLIEVVLGLVEKDFPQGLKPNILKEKYGTAEAVPLHKATQIFHSDANQINYLSDLESDDSTPLRIVDVGTGSGAIAVTLALKLERAVVTAIDLSADALSVARENADRNGARVRFLEGDLLEPVLGLLSENLVIEKRKTTADPSTALRSAQDDTSWENINKATADPSTTLRSAQDDNHFLIDEGNERFDFVVSNPPYVPDVEKAWLSVDVRDHEPHLALFGGEDGLGIYRRLIPQAKDVLVSGGWLVMEMGFGQGERVQDLMEQMGFKEIEIVPDLQGIERIILGKK